MYLHVCVFLLLRNMSYFGCCILYQVYMIHKTAYQVWKYVFIGM